ncbi:anti-sigma factor [Actinocorallia longicatena]|uniref:Regulator of SigK n=1 Tax=Actinocorallia longicatena TaxID=111803 RepID=A0ABP6QD46_9ACTN
MNAHDTHGLLGAYVMDAVDDLERRRFEEHLAGCEMCAEELIGLRETAARLAVAGAQTPPPELKDRVMAEITRTRQLPPVPRQGSVRARRLPRPQLLVAVAACLVAALVFAVAGIRGGGSDDGVPGDPISEILAAPDARTSTGTVTGGGTVKVVASRSHDQAVVFVAGVGPAPAARTYQLWLMGPEAPRSAGLMKQATAPVVVGGLGSADQVGMTVEKRGGSAGPTGPPLFAVALPPA